MAEKPAIDDTVDAAPGHRSGPWRWCMRIAAPLLAIGILALVAIVALDSAQ
ncbi:MAG: hypothetical protein JSS21_04615, partial [Proteobacteria bacterium]|nr:hypothetical protein [Pseudomonadota bacterium]